MPDPRIFPLDAENISYVWIGAVSTLVIAGNGMRVGLDLTHVGDIEQEADPEFISLGLGQAAVNYSGKVLTAVGSSYHMGTANLFNGDIYAICPSGGMYQAVSEEVRTT